MSFSKKKNNCHQRAQNSKEGETFEFDFSHVSTLLLRFEGRISVARLEYIYIYSTVSCQVAHAFFCVLRHFNIAALRGNLRSLQSLSVFRMCQSLQIGMQSFDQVPKHDLLRLPVECEREREREVSPPKEDRKSTVTAISTPHFSKSPHWSAGSRPAWWRFQRMSPQGWPERAWENRTNSRTWDALRGSHKRSTVRSLTRGFLRKDREKSLSSRLMLPYRRHDEEQFSEHLGWTLLSSHQVSKCLQSRHSRLHP